MALIDCTECGKQVSTAAQACPNCGHPVARMRMKCPYCRNELASNIETCPHCQRRIFSARVDPSKQSPHPDPIVEIQQKQLYWIRFVGVFVALVLVSWIIAQCQHSG